jgi:hypothetical protein
MVARSLNTEEVWCIEPDLMASKEKGGAASRRGGEQWEADSTVALESADLREISLPDASDLKQMGRHYANVSLRGALLAPAVDDDDDDELVGSWNVGLNFVARFRQKLNRRPSAGPLRSQSAFWGPQPHRRVMVNLLKQLGHLGALFEPGRVEPLRLAVFSFLAGVTTTLLGVVLAL